MNKYEQAYQLETEEGVTALLEDYHQLREARYWSNDLSISDLLLDFETALEKALTPRQKEIIETTYFLDRKQSEVAEILNITQQTVQEAVKKAIKRLAVYHQIEKDREEE